CLLLRPFGRSREPPTSSVLPFPSGPRREDPDTSPKHKGRRIFRRPEESVAGVLSGVSSHPGLPGATRSRNAPRHADTLIPMQELRLLMKLLVHRVTPVRRAFCPVSTPVSQAERGGSTDFPGGRRSGAPNTLPG